jgi:hypothetical protein
MRFWLPRWTLKDISRKSAAKACFNRVVHFSFRKDRLKRRRDTPLHSDPEWGGLWIFDVIRGVFVSEVTAILRHRRTSIFVL